MTNIEERLRDIALALRVGGADAIENGADEIKRLRAELNRRMHPGQGEGYALEEDRLREVVSTLRAEVTAREALIAEALAALPEYSFLTSVTDWPVMVERAKAILSRTPQGAADRRGEAGDGLTTLDDPAPLGSDQRVTPNREALADVLSGIGWDGSNGAPRGYYLDRADALIASGVFGVSADLIRAEALEAASEAMPKPMYHAAVDANITSPQAWLLGRAAEYRKVAEHPAHSGHEYGGAYARAGALAAGDPDWMNATGGQPETPVPSRETVAPTRLRHQCYASESLVAPIAPCWCSIGADHDHDDLDHEPEPSGEPREAVEAKARAEVIDWFESKGQAASMYVGNAREHFRIEADHA